MRHLRDWTPGDNVHNNEHHQQAVAALRELDSREANGKPGYQWAPAETWPAKIVATGPSGAADRTDQRYWLKKCYVVGGVAETGQISFNPDVGGDYVDGPVETVVTGHNLPELPYHGHNLATDGTQIVWVTVWFDRGDPQRKRYIFNCPPVSTMDAIVTGSARDGVNWRWTYDLAEAEKSGAGYGSWTAAAGGWTGTGYNSYEEINGASGLVGVGVDVDLLPAGFELQPVPDGLHVVVTFVQRTDDATEYEAWFARANGVNGECP